jgi:hypothetical protein
MSSVRISALSSLTPLSLPVSWRNVATVAGKVGGRVTTIAKKVTVARIMTVARKMPEREWCLVVLEMRIQDKLESPNSLHHQGA